MCHVNPGVYALEFGGTQVGYQYLIGAFPARLRRILLELIFPIDEISRLQHMMLKVFISQEHTVKRLL